jgi:hypothetical protein
MTDQISALIFTLLVLAVVIYIVMSKYVIGPIKALKKAERIMLVIMLVGVGLVIVYAATELLFHIVF